MPVQINQFLLTDLPGPKENEPDYRYLLNSLGKLWQSGISIDWESYNQNRKLNRVSMPTYAFIKHRYWIEAAGNIMMPEPSTELENELYDMPKGIDNEQNIAITQTYHQRPNLSTAYVAPKTDFETVVAEIWQDLIGIDKIGINDNFYELGGHSLLATQMIARFKEAFSIELTLNRFMEVQTVKEMALIIIEEIGNQFGEENLSLLLDELEESN
ncbi:MAG: hypothetical protein HC831_19045 [Chloroflexia bacterium]|nr:hypothetical protein [Chloroflexia bacterium]